MKIPLVEMPEKSKYARIERERRFLLDGFPEGVKVSQVRRITDRYVEGTTLRLREMTDESGQTVFKFTQKLPAAGNGAEQGFITNIYLTREEFDVLAQLPARTLKKTRYSVPPFGIDVFEESLEGLVLAEAEFDSDQAADELRIPSYIAREVTADRRFTGGSLVGASRSELKDWLLEYGVKLI